MNRGKSLSIAINALLLALTVIFCVVPIQLGPIRLAVLMLMPVLVAGQTQRFGTAVFAGLFLGLVSMTTSYIAPGSVVAFAFQNPLISVLPRIFIGIVVYLVFHGIRRAIKTNDKLSFSVAATVSAMLGIMTNTGLVSLMLWAFYGKTGIQGQAIDAAFMQTVILVNFLIELAVCTIITPPISLAVNKTMERAGGH